MRRLPVPSTQGPPAAAGFDDDDELERGSQRRVAASRLRDLEAIESNARRVSQQAKEAAERAEAAEAQALFLVGERTRMATLIAMMGQRLGCHAFVAPLPAGQEGYRTMIGVRLPAGLVWWEILDADASIPRGCGIPDGPTPMGADRLPPEQMYQIVLSPGLENAAGEAPAPTGPLPVLPGGPGAETAPQAAGVDLGALPTLEEALAPAPAPAPVTGETCAPDGSSHVPGPDGAGCACGYFGAPKPPATPATLPATPSEGANNGGFAGSSTETPSQTPSRTSHDGGTETAMPTLPATGPQPDGSGTWGYRCAACSHQVVGIKGRKAARASYQAHRSEAH